MIVSEGIIGVAASMSEKASPKFAYSMIYNSIIIYIKPAQTDGWMSLTIVK